MKAIIFDFDGTLANTLPVNIFGFQEVFKKFDQKDYSKEEIKEMFGPPEPELIEQNLQSNDVKGAVSYYYQQYEENHNRLVDNNQEIDQLLSNLKDREMKLGVVTGKSRKSFEYSLAELNMKKYFDILITGDDVKEAKPAPEGILQALKKLEVSPEEAMYIGDSDDDMNAGKKAGVHIGAAKWLPEYQSSEYSVEPEAIFQEVSDLINYLEKNHDD
ncbi:HAD family hydrolase [Sediminibacillus halophilus]|uniref:Phosphoglycolate phosphatase/pyrophosphatase PpaX n=1 Tax=Sediminibacillus halophilus TaxID=482461 RepID=A0A1G9NNQ3_9BACI|nr:HAD family hydrolase [Sediminibacillus halophilus]SDL87635.1 phosphoglycolate phosphatase/pyrophosphatase PpaX [Sediminibacillus halophilus]